MPNKISEFELIDLLTKNFKRADSNLIRGIGDDCAVIDRKDIWEIITTDALLEDVHFDPSCMSAEDLGYKALASNLSDIAAMGGEPKYFFVSISLPASLVGAAKKIYDGILILSNEAKCMLAGGDTTSSPDKIYISITVVGETKPNKCLFRNGAKAGDSIFASGHFGMAALGLKCPSIPKLDQKLAAPFVQKFKRPAPRLSLGKHLAKDMIASAMIDSSDGLLADLGHIADESSVGFELDLTKIPMHGDFKKVAKLADEDPTKLLLTGGEDYELIFTVPKEKEDLIKSGFEGLPLTRIGTVLEFSRGRHIIGDKGEIQMDQKGFDHFLNAKSSRKRRSHPWEESGAAR